MQLRLHLLKDTYAVAQLPAAASVPPWADGEGLVCIARTDEELSILCLQERVAGGNKAEPGWRCLKLQGPFEFTLTGILASILNPLADANIGIFAFSTFNTDYVLVKDTQLEKAIAVLESAGHWINVEG
jgi:hypothetical protein